MNRAAIAMLALCACKPHGAPATLDASAVSTTESSASASAFQVTTAAPDVSAGLEAPDASEAGARTRASVNAAPQDIGDLFGAGGLERAEKQARSRTPGPPAIHQGEMQALGRLAYDVIQRVVRQSFPRFMACYKDGLRGDPSLEGRVTVKFRIDRDGTVGMSQNGGSDLPDEKVTVCVIRSFDSLRFPQPDGSTVTVVYPLVFTAGTTQ